MTSIEQTIISNKPVYIATVSHKSQTILINVMLDEKSFTKSQAASFNF